MTGLLHRLAARATGTAWTLRSDVRLPFGTSSLEQAQDAPPSLADAALPEQRTPMQARSGPADPAATATPRAVLPAGQPRAAAAPPDYRQPTHSPVPADQPTPATAAAPQTLMSMSQQPAPPRTTTVVTTALMPPSELAPGAPAATPPVMASARSTVRPKPPSSSLGEEPAPLLPPRPRSTGHAHPLVQAVPAPPPFAPRAPQTAGASADTEVHIHIGRIDVTALHEAPRPKARPRERTQPVSLDAYLAARSKS